MSVWNVVLKEWSQFEMNNFQNASFFLLIALEHLAVNTVYFLHFTQDSESRLVNSAF